MGRSRSCFCATNDNKGLKRGVWTPSEDKILSDCIKIHGFSQWKSIANKTGLKRCARSCRFRWLNYLRPEIKRGNISPDEEELLIRLHRLLGNRWSLIAGRLPGRSDNEIKNYWNTHLRKKLQMGELEPKLQNPFNRMDTPFDSSNHNVKEVEDIYDGLSQNTALKTRSVRYWEKEVVDVENLDCYNYDHVPYTHDGINPEEEEDMKAADYHVGEPSFSQSGSEILQGKQSSSSCNLLEQEFLHTENFNSAYFESLVELEELSSLLV